jgi:apolipoprotein N-acyltransferase
VETGLPVIRVGNSGVTGVFYPDGRGSWLTGKDGELLIDELGCKVERVAIPPKERREPTPYTRFGDIPLFVLFILTALYGSAPAKFGRAE